MFPTECAPTRRNFLMVAAAVPIAASGLALVPQTAMSEEADINIIGPKKGYSPQIGTLVSMMTWMRMVALRSVKGMTQKDLDHLADEKANSIGALLMHLAATDAFYHAVTFGNMSMKELPESFKREVGHAHGTWGRGAQGHQGARSGFLSQPVERNSREDVG